MSYLTLLLSLLLGLPNPVPPAESVFGRAEMSGDVRIVHVFGSPDQMGYAHGYLAGEDFVVGMQELYSGMPPAAISMADFMRSWAPLIQLTDAQRVEVAAVYRGMRARLGLESMQLPGADRMVDETDLLIWNGYDMFRAVGCSGFTAWGSRTKDGEVITARNLDLGIFSPRWASNQIVLVRHPSQGKATACVTPAGLVGIMTGINEDGVCGFLHDGNGPEMDAVLEPERPVMFAIRDILERANSQDAFEVAQAELALQGPFPYSYMVRIITPRSDADATPPARVYRLDSTGLGQNASQPNLAITTNHYLDSANLTPSSLRGDSAYRYSQIHQICHAWVTSRIVTVGTAWAALRRVGADHLMMKTLHAVVIKPESGEFQVSVAVMDDTGHIECATNRPPVTLSRSQLFDVSPPMVKINLAPAGGQPSLQTQ